MTRKAPKHKATKRDRIDWLVWHHDLWATYGDRRTFRERIPVLDAIDRRMLAEGLYATRAYTTRRRLQIDTLINAARIEHRARQRCAE